MRHLKTQLREVSVLRCVGFQDAVDDLGMHRMHGVWVPFTRGAVYAVLTGRYKGLALRKRIAYRRPDLFKLRFVSDDVKAWYEAWRTRRRKENAGRHAGQCAEVHETPREDLAPLFVREGLEIGQGLAGHSPAIKIGHQDRAIEATPAARDAAATEAIEEETK